VVRKRRRTAVTIGHSLVLQSL
jgi:hypothetical protein